MYLAPPSQPKHGSLPPAEVLVLACLPAPSFKSDAIPMQCVSSAPFDILDRPVLVDVDIQPIRIMVHAHHATGLDDTVVRGEVLFGEGRVVRRGVGEGLAHELGGPVAVVALLGVGAGNAGDHERHCWWLSEDGGVGLAPDGDGFLRIRRLKRE